MIAVIAILAALLLPALNRTRAHADSTVCRSNLRQILLGLSMYVQQFNAYPSCNTEMMGSDAELLMNQLVPLVGAPWPEMNYGREGYLGPRKSVYACPGYNRAHGAFFSTIPYGALAVQSASYAYNFIGGPDPEVDVPHGLAGWGFLGSSHQTNFPAIRENQVVKPSDMFAFGDTPFFEGSLPLRGGIELPVPFYTTVGYNQAVRGLPVGDPRVRAILQRHGGRWNIGFCDGHVENLRAIDVFSYNNPAVARRWNNDNQPHNDPGAPPPQ